MSDLFDPPCPPTEVLPVITPDPQLTDQEREAVERRWREAMATGRTIVTAADLEYQHRAELDEIDLPPNPLDANTPPWLHTWSPDWMAIAARLLAIVELAIGVALGYLITLMLLAWPR